ncbi:MAG: enoyl-CoA hydratase, partial [Betaproteobacteria bacterium]|nr:enoyl-CoA hydratase [Betaproteobacteria bacterium]
MVTLYAEGDFLISRDEGIVTATFNRAQTRNALTFDMYERLSRLCLEAAEDPSLKAIILTGAGDKAFAAGTDIAQFRAFTSGSDGIDYEQRIEAVLEPVEKCPVPLIAAIAGACTGGGAAIAACCDLRVATADMRFGFPIARSLGNTLSMGNFRRLVDLLGPARVKHMIFTAELMQAQEA